MRESTIGESPEVRYRVCLIARTWGSRAAWEMNAWTEVENESYGWWRRISPRAIEAKTLDSSDDSTGAIWRGVVGRKAG